METETLEKDKIKAVPELRFKEFEDKWKTKRLENLADVKGGKRIPKGYSLQEDNNGNPYITVSDMRNGTVSLPNIRFVPKEVIQKISNYRIKTSDLFISVAGTLGIIGKIPKELENANLTENANKLTNLKCDQEFLLQYLQTNKLDKLIENVKTSNAQPKLAIYAIKAFIVNHPSLPEQQKIASFLSVVDKKIQQLSRKRELLEIYKKGVMQKLFSQEIRFKDENGKDYPNWAEKKLGEIASFLKGKDISKNDILEDGINPCIRYGELYTLYKETIDHIFSRTNLQKETLILSKAGDVIIPASGETQIDIATASCVLKEGIALGGDLNIIRGDFNGVFLAYYLNAHLKNEIARLSQGSSVIHLYAKQLMKLKLHMPATEEQQKIADLLSAIDKKIEAVSQQTEKTQTFKKGLLQQMFV